ncbi:MAG: 3-phosphoshikimate 1-carboxyvinyltransferase [Acutalibacteraceae bacterium]|nr:3-phosphoshikimate 1-carboxyvinyltransferase [Acutalibacteraceae bacterium]
MEEIKILPSPLSGEVIVPPSKSAAHRNIICAALTGGESVVSPVCHSEDIDATISCVKALGATVDEKNGAFYIRGINRDEVLDKDVVLDCGESGSTLRFMIPIAAALGVNATFIGHGRLPERPITALTDILWANSVVCSSDKLPLTIKGKLKVNDYPISGNISSQYLTGLLFAIGINGGTARLTTPLQSAGYIDLTMKIMSIFGVKITENSGVYSAMGGFTPTESVIEGDWSQACFFLSAAALGGEIKIKGLDFGSTQGDMSVIDLYKKFGAEIEKKETYLFVKSNKLKAIEIDCSQIPDAVPALAVVAAMSEGKTKIYGGERLRIKETDRIKTVIDGLNAMGISVEELPDGMIITGGKPKGSRVIGTGDHRIVMAFAVLASYAEGETIIEGYKAINKSYPLFFEDFKRLGGKANVITDR